MIVVDVDTALDIVKNFIRETAPSGVIEKRALLLAGEPQDKIERGMTAFCEELSSCFAQQKLSKTFATAFTIAASEMVRERIAEMGGGGRAWRSNAALAVLQHEIHHMIGRVMAGAMMRGGPLELRAIMEALFNRLPVSIAGQGYAVMIGFV